MQPGDLNPHDLPQQALLRVREAEERVSRQLGAIRELERIGQATVAYDAGKLLNAWMERLHTARRNLELARVARRTVGSDRLL
jgi:hypothetical protein